MRDSGGPWPVQLRTTKRGRSWNSWRGKGHITRRILDEAKQLLHAGIAPGLTKDPVELAAWTQVCRVILNLHETITRY